MKVKILLIGAVVLLALTAAYAADVTGKWVAETPGRDGNPTQTTFIFKVEGSKLTGTMQGAMGDPVQITEGKVDGDNVSFVVVRQGMGGGEMKITYKGVVSGDELKLTREFQMPPGGMGGPGAGGPPPGAAAGGGPGGAMGGGRGGGGMSREIIAKRVK